MMMMTRERTSTDGTNTIGGSGSRIRLTAKPHAFAGAVLSPKHAQELNPSLCLAISSALAQQQQQLQLLQQQQQQQQQIHTLHHPPTRPRSNSLTSSGGGGTTGPSVAMVPYTLWITEAWRVLGWAEPSAALFWEMATMYYTLVMASRASNGSDFGSTNYGSHFYNTGYTTIPPLLSCGSTSSLGSGTTMSDGGKYLYPGEKSNSTNTNKKFSSSSAKELPLWIIGTFLLLHCEEYAYERNLAGHDERRFFTTTGGGSGALPLSPAASPPNSVGGSFEPMDFAALNKNMSLSPR